MSEDQKAAQEAEEVVETTTDDETSNDQESEESKQEINYAELLERETNARKEAEKAAADLAFKLRQKRRDGDYEEEEEEKPLTAKQLQTILADERQATEKKLMSSEADRIASSLTNSNEEKAVVLEIHKNRTFPAYLSLQDQIEESYVIANRKKILGENSELKRALKGRDGVTRDVSAHQDQPSTKPNFSSADNKVISQLGFNWNATTKRFEKKLANGRILAMDSKTKKSYLI